MRQGLGPRRCRRTEEGLAANHSGIWGRCRAALVAARGRRGRLQGGEQQEERSRRGRWTGGGGRRRCSWAAAARASGSGGGESPVDEHERVSIRNDGGGREKGWAAGCIRRCGANAGGAAAWAHHFATLAVRVTGCHAGSCCGAK